MTYQEIKDHIRSNLNDAGVLNYSETDLIESVEDAEAEISFLARHIIKTTTLPFQATPYYDFRLLGVEDFLCVTAIFNENTNRWLRDDLTLRDFDRIRDDWELWTGTPQHWAPVNFELNAIVPYMPSPSGNLVLYYAAKASELVDSTLTPLIATDCQRLLELYSTGDLLEQFEEYTKANEYFNEYYPLLADYSARVKNQARRDLLVLI
jgi:hypothetical protein